jgi:hypothetical protein
MRLETLVLAKSKYESGLQSWTSGSQRRVLCHVTHFVLYLRLHSRQADSDRALIVVRHTSAARVYNFTTDRRVRSRILAELSWSRSSCRRLSNGKVNPCAWRRPYVKKSRPDVEHTSLLNQLSSLAHTPKRVPVQTVDLSTTSSFRKHASASLSAASAEILTHKGTTTAQPPRVVRRVQAVIEDSRKRRCGRRVF